MLLKYGSLFFIMLLTTVSFGQKLKGIITNTQGEPIKFATIYVEELQTGTSANMEGNYEIHLQPGTFTINYRALGYSPLQKTVEIGEGTKTLNVELPQQSYILAGVTVRADDEDPAYAIMRKAIARAPGFARQAKSYTSEVYIKGSVVASKIPRILQKRMEVNGEQPQEGETYVNESINRLRFKAPDNYTQEVISVNNSFPIDDNDVPVIGFISSTIYESQEDFFISPFAPNAFSHYKFSYEGLLQDGAWFIDKIKVTPKRKSKLLMEGYLYIVEDLWCAYSFDMTIHPPYVDLHVKQHYAPVAGNSYFPVNLYAKAEISIMGIKAKANYTTTIKYDSIVLDPMYSQVNVSQAIKHKVPEPEKVEEPSPEVKKLDKEIDEILKKDEITNREMIQVQKLMSKKSALVTQKRKDNPLEITSNYKQIVKKDALVRDSLYWDSVRPVPASAKEKISYKKVQEKEEKQDSASLITKIASTTFFGNWEWDRSRKHYVHYAGLISAKNVGFNPVDGWQAKQFIKYRWEIDSLHILRWEFTPGYAINREKPFGETYLRIYHTRLKRGLFKLKAGYLAGDYNKTLGTTPLINATYNLFFKENYTRLYQNSYLMLNNNIELMNGLEWQIQFKWQQTDTLNNNTNFSFLYPNKTYDANHVVNATTNASHFLPRQMYQLRTEIYYTPKQYYEIKKGIKYNRKKASPTFRFAYEGTLPIKSGFANYHKFEAGIQQKVDIYTISELNYAFNVGVFAKNPTMHFSNFQHFKTLEPYFVTQSFNEAFFLLNNYEYSTNNAYLEGHLKYQTQFLILKRLPWLSNKFWTENLFANMLWVNEKDPYFEVGYSMGQILLGGEVGVFAGFKGNAFHGIGVRAKFDF